MAAAAAFAIITCVTALPTPAVAAPLGEVRISQTSGTVDANPVFKTATASAPCPNGYGNDAQVRVGPPGGPFANVAKPLTNGGYDKQPVSAQPNRSFTTALGGAPADGEWLVVVECYSLTQGMYSERFATSITVSGTHWRLGRPQGAAPLPTGAAATLGGGEAPTVAPSGGPAAGTDPSAATADPAPSNAAPGQRLAGDDRTGAASLANAVWMLAVLGVLSLVGVTWLLTRRRTS